MIQILNRFIEADIEFTRFITLIIPHNVVFDYFFAFLSLHGNSIVIWSIILLLLLFFEEKKDKRFIIYFFVSFFITSVINNTILKNLFQRPRPVFHIATPLSCPTDFGLPSGHAAAAFSAAVIFSHFDPKRRWLYYTIASLIGLSRIYLGCHYFLDVVSGAIVGSTISYLTLLFTQNHKPLKS